MAHASSTSNTEVGRGSRSSACTWLRPGRAGGPSPRWLRRVGEHHRQVHRDPAPGLCPVPCGRRRRSASVDPAVRPVASARSANRRDPAWLATPWPSAETTSLGCDPVVCTQKVPSCWDGRDLRQASSSQLRAAQGALSRCRSRPGHRGRRNARFSGPPGAAFGYAGTCTHVRPPSRLRVEPSLPALVLRTISSAFGLAYIMPSRRRARGYVGARAVRSPVSAGSSPWRAGTLRP